MRSAVLQILKRELRDMHKEHDYRDILKLEYESRKARNQYYSLRAFAKSIGIGSGALSEILNGKRNLGLNKATSIVENLSFNPEEKTAFLNSVKEPVAKNATEDENENRQLTLEVFEIVSSPTCAAIFAASDLDHFVLDSEWIASKLSLKRDEVDHALHLMRKVGLIETVNGVEEICDDYVLCPDGVPSRAVKNYHHQMLDKASLAIEEQPVEKRDVSGISFALDCSELKKLKKDILQFQNRMIKKYSKGTKNQVYHIEVALFPLSKEEI